MNLTLIQLREELIEAQSAFTKATEAIESAEAGADLDSLKAAFDTAEERFNTCRLELEAEEQRQAYARQQFELRERAQDAKKHLTEQAETPRASVKNEPLTYTQHGQHSIFTDLARRELHHDQAASERLARHQREMQVERAEKFDLSSTDAAGGYLVAPLWLQDEFVDLARARRVTADVLGARALPANTDSINIPTLSTGTATAVQADNGSVQETDAAFSTVAAAVKTIAGLQDVSQQLVDRSVPGVDGVIFADLVKDYAVQLDTAVLNSSTTSNKGLLQVSGINSVTYTDASPTLPELYPKIASAINSVHTGIYSPPTAIVMHPRRWAFCLSQLDSSNRPLIVPNAQGPNNAAGQFGGVVSQGSVGSIQGVPVYVDANVPTTLGSGTNEDRIIVLATDECYLWEDQSGPYLETFRDVGSGTLTVRFRLHNYYAQCNERRPTAISVISGTGLAAPSF